MFNVGDRVISEYYGEGTVIDIIGINIGDIYPIEVQFDRIDVENGDTDGIHDFTVNGYYDCDERESDMIKLIVAQITNKVEGVNNNMSNMNDTKQTNELLRKLSDNNRKFKIKYRDIQQYINKDDLRNSKVKVIIGTIENFNNQGEVVINGDGEYGFCIIQYRQILQMEEIIE